MVEHEPLFTYPVEAGDIVDEWSIDNDYEAGLANRAFEIGFKAGLEKAAEICDRNAFNPLSLWDAGSWKHAMETAAADIRTEKKPTGDWK